MLNKIFFLALGLFLLVAVPTGAEEVKGGGAKPLGAEGSPQLQPDKSKWGKVATYFDRSGGKRCAPRIQQVVDFLTAGSKSGATAFIPAVPRDPDNSMLSVSMEVANGDTLAYASASFHPRQEQECGGVYETVTYWQNACSQLVATQYPNLKKNAMLAQVTLLEVDPGTRIFLMPAGQGCIAIKKQVIF